MGKSKRTASKGKGKQKATSKPNPKAEFISKPRLRSQTSKKSTQEAYVHKQSTPDPKLSNVSSMPDSHNSDGKYHRIIRHDLPNAGTQSRSMDATASSSRETKSSRSTYGPSSGTEPYARTLNATERREVVKKEIEGSIIREGDSSLNPQPKLLDRFFPNNGDGGRILGQLDNYFFSSSGWTDWPDDSCRDEGEITDVFVPLFNKVAELLGFGERLVAIDRQDNPIPTRDGGSLKPDIFVRGNRSSAFPPVIATIYPQTQREKERVQEEADEGSTYGKETVPPVDWAECAIAIEIKTEDGKSHNDIYQLGTYVREAFVAQPNRRFMPSLLLTQSYVQFILWDRSGVLVSERLNYHSHPERFCDILVQIVKWDDQELGFDPSIFHRDGNLYIKTENDLYVVKETLFRSYTILGRGSTSWRARKIDDEDTHARYVILDSWVPEGSSTERSILAEIERCRMENNIVGLPPLIGAETVEILERHRAARPDKVHLNRRRSYVEMCVDLVHSRSIIQWNGRRLEDHSGLKELFGALHDAIDVHGKLYEKTGILHGDICPWNIVRQPQAQDIQSPRATLIDFTWATSEEEKTFATRSQLTPGALFYSPVNSLNGFERTYFDELQSFYWVLIFMLSLYAGNDVSFSRASWPEAVESLKADCTPVSISVKVGHFHQHLDKWPLYEKLDKTSQGLVKNLFNFFKERLDADEDDDGQSSIPPQDSRRSRSSKSDCREVVQYFEQALRELNCIVYVNAIDDAPYGEGDPELTAKIFCSNSSSVATGEEVVQFVDMVFKDVGFTYFG